MKTLMTADRAMRFWNAGYVRDRRIVKTKDGGYIEKNKTLGDISLCGCQVIRMYRGLRRALKARRSR